MKYKEYSKLSKEEKKKVTFKEMPFFIKLLPLIFLGIVVSIIMVIATSEKQPPSIDQLSREAYFLSQRIVKENLKSPSTANFPIDDYKGWLVKDSVVLIKGYVDSQNGFGATVRSKFTIKWQYLGGDLDKLDSWKYLTFNFEQ